MSNDFERSFAPMPDVALSLRKALPGEAGDVFTKDEREQLAAAQAKLEPIVDKLATLGEGAVREQFKFALAGVSKLVAKNGELPGLEVSKLERMQSARDLRKALKLAVKQIVAEQWPLISEGMKRAASALATYAVELRKSEAAEYSEIGLPYTDSVRVVALIRAADRLAERSDQSPGSGLTTIRALIFGHGLQGPAPRKTKKN